MRGKIIMGVIALMLIGLWEGSLLRLNPSDEG
jgi:hypothetical protein